MSNLSVFAGEFDGSAIRVTEDGQFSVYDVLVAFGVTDKAHTQQTLQRIASEHSEVNQICVNFKFPGRGQKETPITNEEGIYQILMLCPGKRGAEFRSWAAKIVRERREEESNGELAYKRGRQRAINAWRKQGKTDSEISLQLKAIESRCGFTDTLKAHGIKEAWEYATITNEIYLELFGQSAKDIRESRGLAKNARIKDALSPVEVAANWLTETMATQDINDNNLQGFRQCKKASTKDANKVKRVFE